MTKQKRLPIPTPQLFNPLSKRASFSYFSLSFWFIMQFLLNALKMWMFYLLFPELILIWIKKLLAGTWVSFTNLIAIYKFPSWEKGTRLKSFLWAGIHWLFFGISMPLLVVLCTTTLAIIMFAHLWQMNFSVGVHEFHCHRKYVLSFYLFAFVCMKH